MADYSKVYAVFVTYAAEPTQANYNELWVVCWQRMRALCCVRYGPGSDPEDIDDIINTATIKVLSKFQAIQNWTEETISSMFYWSLRNTAGPYFRKKMRRKMIMTKYLGDIEHAAKILLKK